MNRSRVLAAVYAFLCLCIVSPYSYAAYIYSYVGNTYTNIQDQNPPEGSYSETNYISVTFMLPALLTGDGTMVNVIPDAFTIDDQRFAITDQTPDASISININPDASGEFSSWNVSAFTGTTLGGQTGDQSLAIRTENNIGTTDNSVFRECTSNAIFSVRNCPLSQDVGEALSNPGTWTVSVSEVPVPATLWLFGSGLLGMIGLARRRAA